MLIGIENAIPKILKYRNLTGELMTLRLANDNTAFQKSKSPEPGVARETQLKSPPAGPLG